MAHEPSNQRSPGMDVFVVMGAKVRSDGTASPALTRRTLRALELGKGSERPLYLLTGGVLAGRPAEARVASELLRGRGVPDEQVIVEDRSRTTLESVVRTTPILVRLPGVRRVVICSDAFHIPRCRVLFALAGVRTWAEPMPLGLHSGDLVRSIYVCLREIVALPVNAVLLLVLRFARVAAGRLRAS